MDNGIVLITGGFGSSSSIFASAELYSPTTGIFTVTGSMNIARGQHTATLLHNGMVLIAGGFGSSGDVASAELYDPASATFTTTGTLNTSRVFDTATLLNNGMVLIVGGVSPSNASLVSGAKRKISRQIRRSRTFPHHFFHFSLDKYVCIMAHIIHET